MSSVASSNSGQKWNPKNLEIRTLSVEKTLEPLVIQVTTLVNNKGPSNKKKGKSKRPKVLVENVERATASFIERGMEIARANPELKAEMDEAVEDTRKDGEVMSRTSHAFADDPCSSMKRGSMVRAARALLSSVTRLLILADMADVFELLRRLKIVQKSVARVKDSTNPKELLENFQAFGADIAKLNSATIMRQNDLKDLRRRDDLAAARADLKKNSMMLYTSSLASLRHPEVAAAKANRDFVYKRVQNALDKISTAVQATGPSDPKPEEGAGELAYALDEFLDRVDMDPLAFNEVRHRPSLEERLESIISGAALMADSSCTREDRRERIVAECNAVRQALQDLLQEYMNNAGRKDKSDDLEAAVDHMMQKTKDLRRQLCKAVIDHVSDSFIDTNIPILVLIEAAQSGDEKQVKEYAQVFREHANKLVEVANLACSMSSNEEGVKMVKMAAKQIEILCPQVINAALTLAARPTSKVAQDNMNVFKESWLNQVQTLTEAVDEITTIENFLAVSEAHILEDVTSCVVALQQGNAEMLDRKGGDIRGRTARICEVVVSEMENYEPDYYTQKVIETCQNLKDQVMPRFESRLENTIEALVKDPPEDPQENDFIDSSRLVYDGVREIRRAVLMIKNPEDIDDSDVDGMSETGSRMSGKTVETESGPTDQTLMRKLPEAEKAKILQNVQEFVEEKKLLDLEISKWDESSNDIIVLAKSMCVIMMDMTDFTRGRGRLKNTTDVIDAARHIADTGNRLDKLARAIAEVCPDSTVKNDLLAYLQRIALYCHQLNMCAKVKAEVQNISGEMIVSGLDSATSLIQAAKNLMNAVVLTVKSSYVASTKYRKPGQHHAGSILWKMKAPEKKPLVRREIGDDRKAPVRRASQKRLVNPAQALSEFKADI
uniref:Catenin alpha-2 n=1 Tax=Phallusia mammillata TaxID=59560 RepID=A0A6F9DAP6_9ASCI|nr:catenin alpha-2 [Phallusia mammillata]